MIDRKTFYDSLRQTLFSGSLTQAQVDGCNQIMHEWERRGLTNIYELAYILATVYHETGFTMEPIRERGGNRYFKNRYDIQGNHPRIAHALGNTQPGDGVKYHGRGFVMITGRHNYRKFGQRYSLDLLGQPDMALDANIATNILFDGMLEGLFTGKRLAHYISATTRDYVNARRVVNGRDRAHKIARHAIHFENALKQATAEAAEIVELIIKDEKNTNITLSEKTVTRVVIVDCEQVNIDLSKVTFTEKAENNAYLVEVRGGKNNVVSNISYDCDYTGWTRADWESARQGVKVSGKNNRVENVYLKGVRFGIELGGIGAQAYHTKVFGFSYDAVRMTADDTELQNAAIKDAFLANPDNHNDAIQLFPQARPGQMHKHALKGIKIRDVSIANNSKEPGKVWMQGVFLTDGRIHSSTFENITVHSDHQHGLSLAEAHDCTLEKIRCTSPDPSVTSHISVNTRKAGYTASRNVRLQHCAADLILIN